MSATVPPTSRLHGIDAATIPLVVATAQALEGGRLDQASQQIAAVIARHPRHPEVLRLLAGIESLRGRHTEAIVAIRSAVEARPDDALYQNTLGTILAEAGEYDDAIAAMHRCCELQPELALAWYNLGVLLTRCVRYDEAVPALREAVRLAPDHLAARALLADMLRVGNRADEAIAEYRKLIGERPYSGTAWWGLADIKTIKFEPGDIDRMQAALADARASDDDRIALGFALAKALDDHARYAESLASIERANTIARARKRWDARGFSAGVDALHRAFSLPPAGADDAQGEGIVFIVSLPRSGSTLIEQILASHSSVEGAGELPDLPLVLGEEMRRRGQPLTAWASTLQPDEWQRLGRRYLERTSHWSRRRPYFTDKLPSNWMYIDAIRAMLPAARIVGVRRDPLETCFSCYRQFLHNNEYTRVFDDLAAFWSDFDRSLSRAKVRHPTRVHVSVYEDLVADPETEIRRLLDFCGLPFERACLEFHRTERDVRSPSAMQVREPLRRDTARAPRYGNLLDPLREALANVVRPREEGSRSS